MKKRVKKKGMSLVVVWAIGEFTKAQMLSNVGRYVEIGVAFLELGLDQSSMNTGNGEEKSIEVVVYPL